MELGPCLYQTSIGTPRDVSTLLAMRSQGFGDNYQYYHDHLGTNGHAGFDWPCAKGTPIYSACDGVVSYVGTDFTEGGGSGAGVLVDAGEGEFLHWHFSRNDVVVGQQVKRGQQIGLSGNTGFSEGPHFHGEWRPHPLKYYNGFYGAVDYTNLLVWSYPLSNDIMTKKDVEQLQALEGYKDPAGVLYWTGKSLSDYLKARLPDKVKEIQDALK